MAKRTKKQGWARSTGKPAASTKVGTTAPDTADDSAVAEKKGRQEHPLVGNEDTKVYPFTVVPPDFDPSKHKGLKKKDFAEEATYFEYRAQMAEMAAKAFRVKAEESKAMGSSKDRAAGKRLKKMMVKAKELRAQLVAQGVDVDAFLGETETDETDET